MGTDGFDDTKWEINGESIDIGVSGKLDTMRAMELDERLSSLSGDIVNITFDFDGLEYIASAGLRVLYWAQEYTEEKGGRMTVRNVSEAVNDIFEMTGFKDMINIE
ncbi:MAG: STAS domain-containing protein [Lachnospiraceae bacterium]|nr:STAS domain-containing protein [Lachnospiraceae bacterium]MCR5405405.1 STAS domain-containing protein [Lachnospiraceae bacterium]